jgi:hypothetical protein
MTGRQRILEMAIKLLLCLLLILYILQKKRVKNIVFFFQTSAVSAAGGLKLQLLKNLYGSNRAVTFQRQEEGGK